ncbi:type II CAAX prenyl endopeptidase Rce1 family protein [Lactobacillus sp. PV012]|uniref:CPBP family glutamic-type intramembrane protease n=1 Tax=Lactobacillus sp. PV012 TaxID=2594494 RepID=UPI0022408011|nr:CPBP family intramembrane glutamic endopeptidase [Lactobacillus sp. PV012]
MTRLDPNTPQSKQGNLVRYCVYLIIYLLVILCKTWAICKNKFHIIGAIFFIIFGLFGLWFYIRRYNREQEFFEDRVSISLLADFGFSAGVSVIVIGLRFLTSYWQARHRFPMTYVQTMFSNQESTILFWFLILAFGVILPILQVYLSVGFFFNYYFRTQDIVSSVFGIMASGIFFAILNGQYSLSLFVINSLCGMLIAWSYLYTQNIFTPIYLAILNGIFMILLI